MSHQDDVEEVSQVFLGKYQQEHDSMLFDDDNAVDIDAIASATAEAVLAVLRNHQRNCPVRRRRAS